MPSESSRPSAGSSCVLGLRANFSAVEENWGGGENGMKPRGRRRRRMSETRPTCDRRLRLRRSLPPLHQRVTESAAWVGPRTPARSDARQPALTERVRERSHIPAHREREGQRERERRGRGRRDGERCTQHSPEVTIDHVNPHPGAGLTAATTPDPFEWSVKVSAPDMNVVKLL